MSDAGQRARYGAAMRWLLAAVVLGAAGAHAQGELRPAPGGERHTLAFTVSGGAALGNYEAGYAWYLGALAARNPLLGDPRIFTGTSAGAANALVALMDRCRPSAAAPQDTLGWNLWTPVGMDTLFDPDATTPIAALSRAPLIAAVERLREAWNQGLAADCDVVLGVSVTRLEPLEEKVAVHKGVPRASEHFVVRVRGRGPGRPPAVSNHVASGLTTRAALLPTGPDGEVSFDALMPAVLASMAFPVAFAPVEVAHCVATDGRTTCGGDDVRRDLFQDGGLFDNQPVALSGAIALRTFDREGAGGFVDQRLPRERLPAGFRFVIIDHSTRSYPSAVSDIPVPGVGARPVLTATVPYLAYVAEQAVLTAHNRELLALAESNPEIAGDALATPVADPPLGELMGTFFGFFDRGVREFDFTLGMRDARVFAEEWVVPRLRAQGVSEALAWPEDAPERAAAQAGWRGYRCVRAVFDGVGAATGCTEPELVDLRAAAQVTLERLNQHCAGVAEAAKQAMRPPPPTAHARCAAAYRGEAPPVAPGLTLGDDWRPGKGEDELNWTLRRLGQHGYRFADLGVEPGDWRAARRAVARILGDVVKTLGARQDGGLPFVLAAGAVRDLVTDVPADHEVHAVIGNGLELGYSGTRGAASLGWLRGHFGVRVDGVASWVGPVDYRHLTLSAMLGAEAQVAALSTGILHSRFGLRAGFSFSTADRLGFGACPTDTQILKPCSNPVIEAYYAASLLGRVRGQFGVAVLPGVMPGTVTQVLLTPAIGGEYEWP